MAKTQEEIDKIIAENKKAGRPPRSGVGRPAGAKNKVPYTIKESVLQAFDEVGGVDFLIAQAKQNPLAFMNLLGKLMPNEIKSEISGPDKGPIKTINVSALSSDELKYIIDNAKDIITSSNDSGTENE